ncbi:MAG: hypothetical protein AB8E15_13850 [Bdellovibrionales bacterium]
MAISKFLFLSILSVGLISCSSGGQNDRLKPTNKTGAKSPLSPLEEKKDLKLASFEEHSTDVKIEFLDSHILTEYSLLLLDRLIADAKKNEPYIFSLRDNITFGTLVRSNYFDGLELSSGNEEEFQKSLSLIEHINGNVNKLEDLLESFISATKIKASIGYAFVDLEYCYSVIDSLLLDFEKGSSFLSTVERIYFGNHNRISNGTDLSFSCLEEESEDNQNQIRTYNELVDKVDIYSSYFEKLTDKPVDVSLSSVDLVSAVDLLKRMTRLAETKKGFFSEWEEVIIANNSRTFGFVLYLSAQRPEDIEKSIIFSAINKDVVSAFIGKEQELQKRTGIKITVDRRYTDMDTGFSILEKLITDLESDASYLKGLRVIKLGGFLGNSLENRTLRLSAKDEEDSQNTLNYLNSLR